MLLGEVLIVVVFKHGERGDWIFLRIRLSICFATLWDLVVHIRHRSYVEFLIALVLKHLLLLFIIHVQEYINLTNLGHLDQFSEYPELSLIKRILSLFLSVYLLLQIYLKAAHL